jgi:hypothetical protein
MIGKDVVHDLAQKQRLNYSGCYCLSFKLIFSVDTNNEASENNTLCEMFIF